MCIVETCTISRKRNMFEAVRKFIHGGANQPQKPWRILRCNNDLWKIFSHFQPTTFTLATHKATTHTSSTKKNIFLVLTIKVFFLLFRWCVYNSEIDYNSFIKISRSLYSFHTFFVRSIYTRNILRRKYFRWIFQ